MVGYIHDVIRPGWIFFLTQKLVGEAVWCGAIFPCVDRVLWVVLFLAPSVCKLKTLGPEQPLHVSIRLGFFSCKMSELNQQFLSPPQLLSM